MFLDKLHSTSTDILQDYIFVPSGQWAEIPVQLAPTSGWSRDEMVAVPSCTVPERSEGSDVPSHVLEVFDSLSDNVRWKDRWRQADRQDQTTLHAPVPLIVQPQSMLTSVPCVTHSTIYPRLCKEV